MGDAARAAVADERTHLELRLRNRLPDVRGPDRRNRTTGEESRAADFGASAGRVAGGGGARRRGSVLAMSTLDRLRGIVQGRSSVPVVAPELAEVRRGGTSVPPARNGSLGTADYARAAIILGGAVVERSEGAVIVVDREYRAGMRHGRTPIGEIASVITDGTDAMKLMAEAWPAAKGIGEPPPGLPLR